MVRLPFNWAASSNDPNKKRSDLPAEKKSTPRNLKNYYHILAVPRNATTKEIEEAYARLHEKYGPHVSISECNPEMQIKMLRDITEAYRVLMNPSRRRVHDMTLIRHLGKEDVEGLAQKIAQDKEINKH